MTKTEQTRLMRWRLKMLQQASDIPRGVSRTCRHFGISSDNVHLFNEKLREWEDYYNYHRPHGALDGQTPYERLLAKTRAALSPTS